MKKDIEERQKISKKNSCLTCVWLWTETAPNCSSKVRHKCLAFMIKGWFSPMKAIANDMKWNCPCHQHKYKKELPKKIASKANFKPLEDFLL